MASSYSLPYQALVERIRGQVIELDQVVEKVRLAWERAELTTEEPNYYLDSVALNLHGFYSGVERLFELIAREIDQALPRGENWHRELLDQMAQDNPPVRPAVISRASVQELDELRRFRHLVRNVYTIKLLPDRMAGPVRGLPPLWRQLRAELLAIADLLETFVDDNKQ